MDILQIVRSLEEFLYEAMTWLLFFPRTLWRVITRPMTLAAEADEELGEGLEQQFTTLISPPLFLMLCVLIAHVFEISMHLGVQKLSSPLAKDIFSSDARLLIYRSVTFAFYPLLMARGTLKREGAVVDRATLRRPFFLQCYLAGPLALSSSLCFDMLRVPEAPWEIGGLAIGLAGAAWYLAAEGQWFHVRLKAARPRAYFVALKLMLGATAMGLIIALAIFAPDLSRSLRTAHRGTPVGAAVSTVRHIETMP
jgi:hypothetical protein